MTYNQLTSLVISIMGQSGNPEAEALLDTFIELGEGRVYRGLRHYRMVKNVYLLSISSAAPFLVPDDFLEARGVWDGESEFEFEFVDPDFLLDNLDYNCPQWSFQGGEILFNTLAVPTATTVLAYYAKPALLISEATGNLIFQQNPDVFLYAALVESIMYLRDEERGALWTSTFEGRLAELNLAAWDSDLPAAQTVRTRTR